MDQNNIVPGIGIGGLQDKYEIKILICYLLKSINVPFSKEQLHEVFNQDGLVNYFSFCDALAELITSGHITSKKIEFDELYTLNQLGIETSDKLEKSLPSSLRESVVKIAMQLLAATKQARENEVVIAAKANGYSVTCMIHEEGFDLMKLELFVPDLMQAEQIEEIFRKRPSKVYGNIINLLIENSN